MVTDQLRRSLFNLVDKVIMPKATPPSVPFVVDQNLIISSSSYNVPDIQVAQSSEPWLAGLPHLRRTSLVINSPPIMNFWRIYTANGTQDFRWLRFELDGIKVNPDNVPRPVTKWAQMGLLQATVDVFTQVLYEKPTAIQSQAIWVRTKPEKLISSSSPSKAHPVSTKTVPSFASAKDMGFGQRSGFGQASASADLSMDVGFGPVSAPADQSTDVGFGPVSNIDILRDKRRLSYLQFLDHFDIFTPPERQKKLKSED
ncbi:Pre-mRNA-processing ATP-dependent RNA helicase PRP5 [Pyrenophora tritici-repentis]|uniref:Pre-mRNA-processing ATP-dependent RNA helicase PRP5 n=1 Tax=Pyrenophora tritici-repentis TaxID=45151 RepID=A0A922T1S3_9PLEO|nr:Pre-mRNA-processing ATP-dependent RNA helicase PRP5 [Pyrenophora tritici-repentis]KAI1516403.1 Pre-mRNA-processing ATP-dependent RNA helicase PRP5 [Pyrenophora tritici-repentis]